MKEHPMLPIQQLALELMDKRNLGAVVTSYGWTWPVHVRKSAEIAQAVVDVLTAKK
jgi:hypothetical protein